MKLVRFEVESLVCEGRLEGVRVFSLDPRTSKHDYGVEEIKLRAPVCPTKVVAVGLNYRDHAEEVGMALPEEPLLFMKPSSSIIGPNEQIVLPPQSSRIDYEAELGVVMGKEARNVDRRDAPGYILGYTCLNDVTARDLQQKDGQWTRAKGFDTFCPIGPWVETDLDPSDLKIELYLNGELKQESRTSQLVFDPFHLVEFISGIMTLYPGDVIATGTTSGIGPMNAEDLVEVRIEGVGSLVNTVAAAS